MSEIKIDVSGSDVFMQACFSLGRVYNHPQTNKYMRDFIRFELQRILGNDKDIVGFLKEPECQIESSK